MVTHSPRITDERLRSWLDTNQLDRERLCLAVLALDRRFIDVQPRQPRGGPDGGRDIQAHLSDGRAVWGAVGFQNSVSDTPQERKNAKRKFNDDLKRALAENPKLRAFVFLTNVNFTVTDKDELVSDAKSNGIEHCDIFDREHLRIVLDAPDGLSVRYQFLQIPLSDAEQAAFFGKWGTDLQSLISQSFESVEKRLARVEFNQERHRPLRHVGFLAELDSETTPHTLPTFRLLISIMPPSGQPYEELHLAMTNGDGKPHCGPTPGGSIAGSFWATDSSKPFSMSGSVRPKSQSKFYVSSGFSEFSDPKRQVTLGDLDENWICIFASRKLSDKIQRVELHGNAYRLWKCNREQLGFDAPNEQIDWPWELSDSELSDEWVRIIPNGPTLHYSNYTPEQIWTPK